MAISHTTFEERLARINKAQNDSSVGVIKKSRGQARYKSSIFTLPFFVGVSILVGGAAYAWAATTPEFHWVIAFAG